MRYDADQRRSSLLMHTNAFTKCIIALLFDISTYVRRFRTVIGFRVGMVPTTLLHQTTLRLRMPTRHAKPSPGRGV